MYNPMGATPFGPVQQRQQILSSMRIRRLLEEGEEEEREPASSGPMTLDQEAQWVGTVQRTMEHEEATSSGDASLEKEYTDQTSSVHERPSLSQGEDYDSGDSSSVEIEICKTLEEQEAEKYTVLSSNFQDLVNDTFDPGKDYRSLRLWRLLSEIELPQTKRFLVRYIRHCTNASEKWLARIIRIHTDTKRPKEVLERLRNILIPLEFEDEMFSCIEKIIMAVRKRRWECCITKKYIDALCIHTLCPTFEYSISPDQKYGVLRAKPAREQVGDPFRLITREVNISKDNSNNSCRLTHLLWRLEMRLIALLYLDLYWVRDKTTVRTYSQLADSRILYSIYRSEECDRPILSYNIHQLRCAIGRLYTRWNDLSPSHDLCQYFKMLRDRICILSISSLCLTIDRKIGSRKRQTGSRGPPVSSPRSLVDRIPSSLNPLYGFGKYIGSNMRKVIESVTGMSIYQLDSDPTQVSRGTKEKGLVSSRKTSGMGKVFSRGEYETLRVDDLYKRLVRKQRIRQEIDSKMEGSGTVFDSIADEGDYRTEPNAEKDTARRRRKTGKTSMLGDTEDQPRIVRQTLRRLGTQSSSSSSSEEEDFDSEEDKRDRVSFGTSSVPPSQRRRRRRRRRQKKRPVHRSSDGRTGSVATEQGNRSNPSNEADDDFFRFYSKGNETIYSRLGESVKDEDICNEVTTHYIVACNKNAGGMLSHPKIPSDSNVSLRDILLSCLSTDTFLVKHQITQEQMVKCVTHTNESFVEETHAMMCQMEQETEAYQMLTVLSHPMHDEHQKLIDGHDILTCADAMPWKHLSCLHPLLRDQSALFYGENMVLRLPYHEETPAVMNTYSTEFEKSKVENVLNWCWAYSRGKRNQFIYKNLRHKLFAHYLHPGEAELLLEVKKKTGASIIPSQIVSQFRQEELDRVEKILREMTTYDVMEQFATFNHFDIAQRNISSQQHGSYLFEKNCHPEARRPEPSAPGSSTVPTSEQVDHVVQFLQNLSLEEMLSVHHERHLLGASPFRLDHDASEEEEEEGSLPTNEEEYPVEPRTSHLKRMYSQSKQYRFLNPSISVPWASPRGLTRLVRVLILECINFFMKEQSPLLDSRSIMFNPLMTIQLCNTPAFRKTVEEREDEQDFQEEDVPSRSFSSPRRNDPRVSYPRDVEDETPAREDVLALLCDGLPTVAESTEHVVERVYAFTPELMESMKLRFEDQCEKFFDACPIIVQCMLGSFLWYPKQALAKECVGADSYLGFHSWLLAMIRHLSEHFLQDLLIHDYLHTESAKSSHWMIWSDPAADDPLPSSGANTLDCMMLYISTRSTYVESEYTDGGMYYRHLLMLLSKIPRFGKNGIASNKCQHLCTFAVKMCTMLFPHILESFSIHLQDAPERFDPGDEERPTETETQTEHEGRIQDRGAGFVRPTNPTVRYIERETDSISPYPTPSATELRRPRSDGSETARPADGYDDDEDEEWLRQIDTVPLYFPKTRE